VHDSQLRLSFFIFGIMQLQNRKILIGITGSIAAYKTILLVRLLVKAGAEVRVVMTGAAKDFVSPLVLSTLSRNKVETDLFEGDAWANHVMLGRWADLFVIAPLSCNTLSKMVHGQCDSLLMAVYLSATCPVLVSPAMDEDMWHHKTTLRNVDKLKEDGVHFMHVGNGELGSGLFGDGRMAEPEEIFQSVHGLLTYPAKPLIGITALVTAGPTYEPIDPVRFIGNHSSGKMGIAIAHELANAGANVQLVLGPSAQQVPFGIEVVRVQTALQMYEEVMNRIDEAEIAVFSAAVADYRPAESKGSKIKKMAGVLPDPVFLEENPDILKACGQRKKDGQVLVGFALETDNEAGNAQQKLRDKQASMIVLNSLNDEGAGFGLDTNKITIFEEGGRQTELPILSKQETAVQIVKAIINYRK
jgi:phosphopantothenoylcysteine decarboxylase / phosphopantothenate---cysteine ligase